VTVKPDLSLAHEARISSLELQLAKMRAELAAAVDKISKVPRPKPVPPLLPGELQARVVMGRIAATVADRHGVTVAMMLSLDKRRVFMRPRWEAWKLCQEAGYSTPVIGRFFGGRDHTTILSGIKRLGEIAGE
jgi:chromosomal replication initiator protein